MFVLRRFPLHPALDVWAYVLLVYFVMFGDYAWGQAVGDDPKYDAFTEGEHIKSKPWKYMPASVLVFFNRGLDARRDRRATVTELLEYAHEYDYVDAIDKMRAAIKYVSSRDLFLLISWPRFVLWHVLFIPRFVYALTCILFRIHHAASFRVSGLTLYQTIPSVMPSSN